MLGKIIKNSLRWPLITLLAAGGTISACASKTTDPAPCDQMDWYELGRRDGAQGSPQEQLVEHQKKCLKNTRAEWETIYTNGRNAGLVDYCEPKNAYELGRMKVPYYYVCPSTVEPRFLANYRKGQAARDLELQNQKLDAEISEIVQKMVQATSVSEQDELQEQLKQLRNRRNKTERELRKSTLNE